MECGTNAKSTAFMADGLSVSDQEENFRCEKGQSEKLKGLYYAGRLRSGELGEF